MKRVKLFLKGVCMGVADIIPGVSGGTLALILGIYEELVNTIRGLHLMWLPAVWHWIRGGFQRDDGRKILEAWESMNLMFLVILGSGISGAVIAGGMTLPTLLERYPEVMRALFFGLIVASVWIPFKMIDVHRWKTWALVAGAAVVGFGAAWLLTAPDRIYQAGTTWVEVHAEADDTLQSVSRRGLASWTSEQIFWADENRALRDSVEAANPGTKPDRPTYEEMFDPEGLRERSKKYNKMEVPEGTTVNIPQPLPWYVFIAGLVMVCAMILPGISGSYILLILGVYYFMLNALRTFLSGLTDLSLSGPAIFFVTVFISGALIGILSFARVMSYLLRQFTEPTIGLLVGLMVGGLRGIWPFREMVDGRIVNVMPTTMDGTTVAVIIAAVVGAILVLGLTWLGSRQSSSDYQTH